jgi:hypothetical protein
MVYALQISQSIFIAGLTLKYQDEFRCKKIPAIKEVDAGSFFAR